jgi:ribosomal protein S8E
MFGKPYLVKLGDNNSFKEKRTRGGNSKIKTLIACETNMLDKKTGISIKTKILNVSIEKST